MVRATGFAARQRAILSRSRLRTAWSQGARYPRQS